MILDRVYTKSGKPGKSGKVRELRNGQGKSWKVREFDEMVREKF